MRVKRAARYGFCSGVRVADVKLRRFARDGGRGAVLGQLVHNERVVAEMEALGMRTVGSIDEVDAPTIVFSAHGVPGSFHDAARERGLDILDTTCRFVYDIHREACAAVERGRHLVFVGDPRHREVVGYTHDLDPERFHVVSRIEDARAVDWSCYPGITVFFQTTLNSEDFEDVVRHIEAANPDTERTDTICYATKENQDAARELARDPEVEAVIVVGGRSSANTRHLWEIAVRHKPSYLVQGPDDLDPAAFVGLRCVGLTAGASTPDALVDEVEAFVATLGERPERTTAGG